jgi:hypothetical protein
LLTLEWLLTVAAFATAVVALVRARRLARQMKRLTESYWELRYEHGQLRARVARLDPEQPAPPTDAARQGGTATAFVPLSSLKR